MQTNLEPGLPLAPPPSRSASHRHTAATRSCSDHPSTALPSPPSSIPSDPSRNPFSCVRCSSGSSAGWLARRLCNTPTGRLKSIHSATRTFKAHAYVQAPPERQEILPVRVVLHTRDPMRQRILQSPAAARVAVVQALPLAPSQTPALLPPTSPQDPRRRTVRVPINLCPRGIGRTLVPMPAAASAAVLATARCPSTRDSIAGCPARHRVDILPRRQRLLRPQRLVPAAARDPRARRRMPHVLPNPLLHLSQ